MSIVVSQVTKNYGAQKALDEVTFTVGKGQVTGFLGPNGAGKSTMMKIIACYLPQTSGSVQVGGFDVREQPVDVRRVVGYLPEHNPLYLEMYVKEFLQFIGGIQLGIKTAARRAEEMIELTGLGPERHKKIGALSKGYRQRVGLAQALIHDPQVLIFDEPTTGLDPNQLIEIRALIRRLGKDKTVLLSTHIMQEVEAVCDRVIIINKGKIVADAGIEEMKGGVDGAVYTIEFDADVDAQQLSAIPGVKGVSRIKDRLWQVDASGAADLRQSLFRFAVENQLTVLTLQKKETNLESVFRQLTAV